MPGLGQRAAVFADFVGAQIVDIGFALGLNQLDGKLVKLLEIIRGIIFLGPASRSPASGCLLLCASTYSISSLTGLVSSKRRLHLPPKASARAEVDRNGLDVADVQIAVGLGREAGADTVETGRDQVFFDGFADEIGGRRSRVRWSFGIPPGCNSKAPRSIIAGCFILMRLRAKDSNLYRQIQSLQSYHWTSPQSYVSVILSRSSEVVQIDQGNSHGFSRNCQTSPSPDPSPKRGGENKDLRVQTP